MRLGVVRLGLKRGFIMLHRLGSLFCRLNKFPML